MMKPETYAQGGLYRIIPKPILHCSVKRLINIKHYIEQNNVNNVNLSYREIVKQSLALGFGNFKTKSQVCNELSALGFTSYFGGEFWYDDVNPIFDQNGEGRLIGIGFGEDVEDLVDGNIYTTFDVFFTKSELHRLRLAGF